VALALLTASSSALGAEPAAAPERVIVVLRPGTDTAAAATRARGVGASVERTFKSAVSAYSASVSPAQARRLAADPRVAEIVPDERIAGPDVLAAQTMPTGVGRISGAKSATAHINGVDDRVNADVAIYDTGIDPSHTDLVVAGGYNCTSSNRADWVDKNGHGTHVAGTVGARDNTFGVVGVAPGVRLWAVRILDAKGEGYLSWWLCGLDWIAAQKDRANPARPLIEAVNMSVTLWGRDDGKCGTVNNDLLHRAICRVVARGITVVAAAANDSGSAAKRVPAAYNEVITVSALADTDGKAGGLGARRCWSWGGYDVDDTFADFSNYGSDVDLIAPGKCILSTKLGRTYGYSSGTSMAAPHVTGAAALYRATRPDATPAEVRWALQFLGNRKWKTSTDPDGKPDILLDVAKIGPLRDFAPKVTLPARGLVAGEAGATWSIPLAAGRAADFIEPITVAVAQVPGQVRASITGPTTLWGTASASTLAVTVPPATPAGTYDVVVRAAYRASRVHDIHVPVVVENVAPVAAPPTASLVRGSRTTLTGTPLRLSWAAAVDQSPISRYDVGLASAGGDPAVKARTNGATRSALVSIPFATTRTYAVRALDRPGNLGPWATGRATRVVVVQENGAGVTRSTGWSRFASAAQLGGKAVTASRAGRWLRVTFTGRSIALVGPKGPTRGSAAIRLDGAVVGTANANASIASSRWVLWATAVDPARSHTLEVRLLGTPGRPRFDVDAFLVLR
jgi:subtilisin family serine protease